MAKKKSILERLKDGPVLGDGGYLLELEKRGWVRAGPFTPEVALLHPDALLGIAGEYVELVDPYTEAAKVAVLITFLCCFKGYHTGYGAEGVSKATTEAVVWSSVAILVLDYFLNSVLL